MKKRIKEIEKRLAEIEAEKKKILDENNPRTFFDPENIPKLKKLSEKLDELKIPKKWE